MLLTELQNELKKISNKEHSVILQRFFKTGSGQYGEGDIFIGIKVPPLRSLSKKYKSLSLDELKKLLNSGIHEERLIALFILVEQFRAADEEGKERIFDFYIKSRKYINNWDLVDLSADKIAGAFLFDKDVSLLFELAASDNLWDKRIAMISSFYFIKNGSFDVSLQLSEKLINDKHDLIHKAVGWMLREIGKRDINTLEGFLFKHYKNMPRTMLRYSIEKFPEHKRQQYLKGNI